jgi:hypothetical protein
MDVVNDDEDEKEEDGEDDEEKQESKRTPVKLRGRGGFSHPRGADRSRGYGRGRGGTSISAAQSTTSSKEPKVLTAKADPMDGLASSMSALQFVPHSLYARGKGKGRGTG